MEDLLVEFQKFIDKNSENYEIFLKVKDWKECGDFNGEDVRPVFKIKISKKSK